MITTDTFSELFPKEQDVKANSFSELFPTVKFNNIKLYNNLNIIEF